MLLGYMVKAAAYPNLQYNEGLLFSLQSNNILRWYDLFQVPKYSNLFLMLP
jgi:hypothetical protein